MLNLSKFIRFLLCSFPAWVLPSVGYRLKSTNKAILTPFLHHCSISLYTAPGSGSVCCQFNSTVSVNIQGSKEIGQKAQADFMCFLRVWKSEHKIFSSLCFHFSHEQGCLGQEDSNIYFEIKSEFLCPCSFYSTTGRCGKWNSTISLLV